MLTPVSSNPSSLSLLSLRAVFVLFVALIAVHFQGHLHAQVTGAIIQGIVSDPQGAAMPGVQVTATNVATGQTYSTETNTSGLYEFPAMNPGVYTVAAKAAGFANYLRRDIELSLQQRLRVDFSMQLTTVQQSIEVSGTPTVVDTDSASASHLVGGEMVAALPMYGRNAMWVSRLVAGGNPVYDADGWAGAADTFAPGSISFNGAPAQGNSVYVNGVADQYGNGGMSFVPPSFSVKEVNLQTFALSAEYGQTSGSVISFETKSGTNTPHGALWFDHNQEAFNANDFFSNKYGNPKIKSRRTQFGGNFGGPVYIPGIFNGKNRTFFFGDYAGQRNVYVQSFVNTVPTAAERTGDLSQTRTAAGQLIQIYNPFTTRTEAGVLIRDPFADNKIPQSMIEPIATNILKFVSLPTLPQSYSNLPYKNSYPGIDDSAHFRIDHRLSDKHTLYSSFGRIKLVNSNWGSLPSKVNGYLNQREDLLWTFGYIWVINPRTLFNLRTGIQFDRQKLRTWTTPEDRASLGFPKSFESIIVGSEFPRISSSDMTQVGYRNGGTSFITPNTRAFVTKVAGRHSLTFGYENRLYRTFNISHMDEGGYFSFPRSWTQGPRASTASATAGYGVAALLLGTPSSGSVAMNESSASQSVYHSGYLQDNWRLTKKLTLNAGLRYDYQTPMTERFNRMNRGFDETTPSPIAAQAEANYAKDPIPGFDFKVRGGITFAGSSGDDRYNFEPVRSNFMPRFGAVYAITKKMVVRGGYGLFYLPLVDLHNANLSQTTLPISQLGFASTTTMQTILNSLPLNTLSNPFPQGLVQPTGSTLGMATSLGQSITVYDGRGQRARSHQFQVSVQRELPSRILFDIAYVGSRVHDLPVAQQIDEVPPEYLALQDTLSGTVKNPFYGIITTGTLSAATVAKSQLLFKFPQFTGVMIDYHPLGGSSYNSLQVSANKRLGKGFSMLFAYTQSKQMEAKRFLNPYDPQPVRTIGQIDRPQRLVCSGHWDIPVGKRMRFGTSLPRPVQMAFGNWELTWVATFQRGLPTGLWSSAIVTRPLQQVERSVDKWFETAAFAPKPTYDLVSLSPYIAQIRRDGTKSLNLTIAKDFPIREATRLRLMVQMLNALNTPQFGAPNIVVTNPAFGSVTSQVNLPRWIMLSGSLHF